MATRRVTSSEPMEQSRRGRPAATPEGRENQLVNLAVDLVERQLREGTASSQVISHYLKLGSTRERLEQQRLSNENKLTEAKIASLESQQRIEELYGKALASMKAYQTGEPIEEEDYDD